MLENQPTTANARNDVTSHRPRAVLGVSSVIRVLRFVKEMIQKLVLLIIRGYQLFISPFLGSHCRYYPSCSCYADTAIRRFGSLKGGMMAIKRLSRCHPFHDGGYDPVPQSTTIKKD